METALAVLTMLSLLTGTIVSARMAIRLSPPHVRQLNMAHPNGVGMRAVQAP